MNIKLKKIKSEDIENGEYALYCVKGYPHIVIGKYRRDYRYNDRYGWGQNGVMDWWQAKSIDGETVNRVHGPTRGSVIEQVAERIESQQW